jgi:(S)-ureidoglycine aminohydrolase
MGQPPQSDLLSGRAVFTEAYAVIPRGVQRDIVTSRLPHWRDTRAWIIARPLSGFAETFAHLIVEIAPGGGSETPEPDPRGEAVIFVTAGNLVVSLDGLDHDLSAGGYAYLPPNSGWRVGAPAGATFHWIRKAWEPVEGFAPPAVVFTSDQAVAPAEMPDSGGRWRTQRFIDPEDMSHDMQVNIVTFEPGASIPFMETHVMEHGLYVLEGKAVYRLNRDWVEVEAGDYMWLRAFCPQACYAGGPGRFRYLLYKDINRHVPLTLR